MVLRSYSQIGGRGRFTVRSSDSEILFLVQSWRLGPSSPFLGAKSAGWLMLLEGTAGQAWKYPRLSAWCASCPPLVSVKQNAFLFSL